MTIRVLSVASEAVPLVKTGGLADVAGALPSAVAPHGVAMTTLLPGYPMVLEWLARAEGAAKKTKPLHTWDSLLGEPAQLLEAKMGDHRLLVVDCPALFAREGGPYSDTSSRDWADNWHRFAALGRAAADIAGGAVQGLGFDVVHAHDWQGAMALAYMRFAPHAGHAIPSVMTIHNMAFQGHFGADIFPRLQLPPEAWSMNGVEYHGGVGFLKAGLEAASVITTVSPTYAAEIRDPAFGMGLEGLIVSRGDRVRGLINGIDTAEWNPATDPALASNFSPKQLARRTANKRALEREFGLQRGANDRDGPVVHRRLAPDMAKGHGRVVRMYRPPRRAGRAIGAAGLGRQRDCVRIAQGRRAPSGPRRHPHRLRRGPVAPLPGRRRRHPRAQPV